MENIYQKLMDEYIIKENNSTVCEENIGFTKQYIRELAVYLMKIVLLTLKMSIYKSIGTPGDTKYFYMV